MVVADDVNFSYTANATPVTCVLSDIKSVVILCLSLYSWPDISAAIDVKVCVTIDLSSGQVFSPFGGDGHLQGSPNVTKCETNRYTALR